jgi:hypothetical protein
VLAGIPPRCRSVAALVRPNTRAAWLRVIITHHMPLLLLFCRAAHGASCGLMLAWSDTFPLFWYHAVPVAFYILVATFVRRRETIKPYALFMVPSCARACVACCCAAPRLSWLLSAHR